MKRLITYHYFKRFYACVVGSGPAGFSVASQLLKSDTNIRVDVLEKLPVPYGLIRFGVAPDHQDVKNSIHMLEKVAVDNRFNFYGNVCVGRDITVSALLNMYNFVVMCYGRSESKKLDIPGEHLHNVYSSNEFIGWYNGSPFFNNVTPDFSGNSAVIIGNGNVALDVLRILTAEPSSLSVSDIRDTALMALKSNKIKEVIVVGRRGPLNISFTTRELRTIKKMKCLSLLTESIITSNNTENTPRHRKRLYEVMADLPVYEVTKTYDGKICRFIFDKTPLKIEKDSNNLLIFFEDRNTGSPFQLKANMLIHCIGYYGENIDSVIPFDETGSVIVHDKGLVPLPNDYKGRLYCAGWIKDGSKGTIASTIASSYETVETLIKNKNLVDLCSCKKNDSNIKEYLIQNKIKFVSYSGWQKINKIEIEKGIIAGKIREKITDIDEMVNIAIE